MALHLASAARSALHCAQPCKWCRTAWTPKVVHRDAAQLVHRRLGKMLHRVRVHLVARREPLEERKPGRHHLATAAWVQPSFHHEGDLHEGEDVRRASTSATVCLDGLAGNRGPTEVALEAVHDAPPLERLDRGA